jgi:nucleotide-binding universal stress UspA family protein
MYKEILIPIDLAAESSWGKALSTAVALCRTFEARLHVVNVVPDFGLAMVSQYFPEGHEQQMIENANKTLHALVKEHVPDEIAVQCIVASGGIYHEILDAAKRTGADLIVMQAHRPELTDYLLGPNAAQVARHADCSVMVVRE